MSDLFDYDRPTTATTAVVGSQRRDDATVTEIRYGEGTAAFVVEVADAPRALPGVVYAHGGSRPKKHRFVDQAIEVARAGFVVLLADTSFPPPGEIEVDERAFADAVLVQRRGLDVLEERGAGPLGFFGHSFGGELGAVLAAVEPRLDAIVIGASGTGIVEWARRAGLTDPAYLERLHRLDAIHWVSVPGRRHLLFQHGRRDEVVLPASARALYDAAAEPKRWTEYDCGHAIDAHPPALADRIAFFRERLARR